MEFLEHCLFCALGISNWQLDGKQIKKEKKSRQEDQLGGYSNNPRRGDEGLNLGSVPISGQKGIDIGDVIVAKLTRLATDQNHTKAWDLAYHKHLHIY